MGNELVKFGISQYGFQVEEKVKAFLIRNTRKCIIWILSLQIGDQLGEFMVTPKMFNRIRKGLPAYDGREMTIGLSVAIRR